MEVGQRDWDRGSEAYRLYLSPSSAFNFLLLSNHTKPISHFTCLVSRRDTRPKIYNIQREREREGERERQIDIQREREREGGRQKYRYIEKGKAMIQQPQQHSHHKVLPKRIILVRHGESQGNRDNSAYSTTPDYKISLTPNGVAQAKLAGAQIRRVVSDDERSRNWKVYFYVSPYERTRSTLREIGRSFPRDRIIGVREECRVREQDFGNFQEEQRMKMIKETRERFGRFFYRFPEGESAADVYDRVSSFLETLWRDIDMNRFHLDPSDDLNLIIVSHGLASRVFLTKWFKWTVEQFEYLNNLGNCEFRVVQLGQSGDYSLAIHHTEEEMQEWGLSPDMIADQKWRACGNKGNWYENCQWYLDEFFDKLEDTEDNIEQDRDENEV